jgi:hypothetical protein
MRKKYYLYLENENPLDHRIFNSKNEVKSFIANYELKIVEWKNLDSIVKITVERI